jgi:glycosyltransferase involved in cell wall biosynthesis
VPLRILSVAHAFGCVSPDAPGGAEQVISMLDEALVAAGHRSVVVANDGSRVAGALVPTPRVEGSLDREACLGAVAAVREAIGTVLRDGPVDVVHFHGVDFDRVRIASPPPSVVTLHQPPSWYAPEALARRPDTRIVCVSDSQRAACPSCDAIVVPNGVRLDAFHRDDEPGKGDFVVALGRICPEKGFHLAIDAAERAGVRILLAGALLDYPEDRAYFEGTIRVRLGRGAGFLGAVGMEAKRELLGAARCLLVPSLAAEVSSLVAMEALASGTPVVAFRLGALPDIVEHGKTGFLVSSVEEMADAIGAVHRLRSEDCRAAAEARFSAGAMVNRYIELYEELVGASRRREAASRPGLP